MNKNLFDHVNIDKKNTFVPKGIGDKEKILKEFNDKIEKLPRDIQLLGVGPNGHIAFNEPDEALHANALCVKLDEKTIKANARFFASEKDVPREAIGKGKAAAMKELLNHDKVMTSCPVTFLKLHNDVVVVIDEELADAIGYKKKVSKKK